MKQDAHLTATDRVASLIAQADDWVDPLDGLIERTTSDPGAPLTSETLDRLATLQRDDAARFETVRAQLRAAGCRVGALDRALSRTREDLRGGERKQADVLIDLAGMADVFHAPDGTAYADLEMDGHRQTWLVRAKGFRQWLTRRYFTTTGGAPNAEALQAALNLVEARALFEGPVRSVHVRVGSFDSRLYVDLADAAWRAVEIDQSGWRIVARPPVRFRRAAGMLPLPAPETDGSIEALRSFLNVTSDADFVLAVSWMLAALRGAGPYPVLVLAGEQGTAKSTVAAMLRALLDPNVAALRTLPREERDLYIAASRGHVLVFDNVSGLSPWLSDTCCRLATGGGFATRQLFTDDEEVLIDVARPLLLNGIEDIVTRPDLADRALFLTLQPIPRESASAGGRPVGRV